MNCMHQNDYGTKTVGLGCMEFIIACFPSSLPFFVVVSHTFFSAKVI